ncbi:indoleamine 2,3-dioxygenase [Frankia sp. Cj3]|uniref:indoleamine 2,3-dioxygenase n=1 Tax=Frankia sp. Cj3 TaxID=2880976 RepID=UPI001EF63AC2|nr:indoleamine 2,3-dioxygenase [Frankia sp. Cj3]
MLSVEADAQGIADYWPVTEQLGFLPSAAQTAHSFADCSQLGLLAAESLAHDLPTIEDAELIDRLEAVGEVTADGLRALTPPQAEAAIRAYTFIACRLIHGGQLAPGRTLDSAVARPLWSLAQRLGRAPSLTYATYVLANWQSPVHGRTPPELFNVKNTFTGTPDEAWFIAVHLSIESAGGEIVAGLNRCRSGITMNTIPEVVSGLLVIESALRWSTSIFPRIEERLDPTVFTRRVRKFLFGYQDVRFGGVDSPAISYIGETGAQSGAIRAADAGLGVRHAADIIDSIKQFLSYAPAPHRRHLEESVDLGVRLAQYAHEKSDNADLDHAYRSARAALGVFRDTHLRTVKKYLVGAESPYPDQGTGGTRYQHWLRQLVEDSSPD